MQREVFHFSLLSNYLKTNFLHRRDMEDLGNIQVNYIDLPHKAEPPPNRIDMLNRPMGDCAEHPFCYN